MRLKFISRATNTAATIFLVILMGGFLYLGLNQFQFPTFFVLTKTDNTKALITETKMVPSVKGNWLQLVGYEYVIGDSIYKDKFKVGQRQGLQVVGDELLLKYSIANPSRNKVIGFYRHSQKREKPSVVVSSEDVENKN